MNLECIFTSPVQIIKTVVGVMVGEVTIYTYSRDGREERGYRWELN
jgi:hypothetical protein